ncbi:MAG: glycosyltransferase [Candidatus Eisenbacteria bacterium]|nr:glycosyltransferase [Candidatus Eisenbacteria bacterium]
MVRLPRIPRLPKFPRIPRIPRLPEIPGVERLRQAGNWRARLRAQRAWWRRRLRVLSDGHEVLFPAEGGGVVAVGTLHAASGKGPRIAVLHATAGSGHKSAAIALANALAEQKPDAVVREVDTLVFTSRLYRTGYSQGYVAVSSRAPQLWGTIYALSEQQRLVRALAPGREAFDRLSLRRLLRVVDREKPDAIVCTHFLPVEALWPRRRANKLPVPLYVVITDFTANPVWVYPHVDRYFVASDQVADELHELGVPRERIEVTGIPVDPRFGRTIGREAARAKFGLHANAPVALVMGGGSGVGPMAELADKLTALGSRPQVVVVCGTNEKLRRELLATPAAREGRLQALGFTHDVDALLEAADVVVSKAGGLTCSEALIKRTPLVVFRPTPGQEVRNTQFLESGGAAVHASTVDDVAAIVARWLGDPAARERVRENAGRLAHPDAAADIARRVLEAIGTQRRNGS